MKLLALCITIFCILLNTNFAYGLDYKDNIRSWSPEEPNTQNNIEQSQLIEKYIINYKSKIKSLEERYEIENSDVIRENTEELDRMIRGLRSIQSTLVEKEDATEVIKSVVDGLKIVNNNLKPYLKVKQRQYAIKVETLRVRYTEPTKKISIKINTLIKRIADPMKQESKLSINQKQILKHLIKLEEESKKLNNFWNRSFETTDEIRNYLRTIIKNVRTELQWIKGLI